MSAGPAVLRLATRGSRLARVQTDMAIEALRGTGCAAEALVVETRGDRQQATPAAEMTGQGWFTAEIERVLRSGEAEAAVHSAKDLPTALMAGLEVAALMPRADVCDALVARDNLTLAELPAGAVVGTSSRRREALIRDANPAVEVRPLRGNVDTRLRHVDEGRLDAVVLAAAGLDRLGWSGRITERLDPHRFVPAPAQAAIAVETAVDGLAHDAIACIDDPATRRCIELERAVLSELGGGCLIPLGVYAHIEREQAMMVAVLADETGLRRAELSGDPSDPTLAARLVRELRP